MSYFDELSSVNVNDKAETKNGLTYLSWAWAVSEVTKRYPEMRYEVVKFNGLPYAFDPNTGYMVYTTVTIEGITKEMWLPVMDSANHAMKDKPYEIATKRGKITVDAATMFDINKTIMRCLTKNLSMFGLGLYIYAGEDLPEMDYATDDEKAVFVKMCSDFGVIPQDILRRAGWTNGPCSKDQLGEANKILQGLSDEADRSESKGKKKSS